MGCFSWFWVFGIPCWKRLLALGAGHKRTTHRTSVRRCALLYVPALPAPPRPPFHPGGSPFSCTRRRWGAVGSELFPSTNAQKSLTGVLGFPGLSRELAGDGGWFWAGVCGAVGPRPSTSCSLCWAFSVAP